MNSHSMTNEELQELRRELIAKEAEMRELIDSLGITPSELETILQDKSRFTEETWEHLEKERKRWEDQLSEKHRETSTRKRTLTPPLHIKNHWIPVR